MKNERVCEKVRGLLPGYEVGRLTGRKKKQVEEHIQECETCARELQALQHTGEIVDSMAAEPAPDLWNVIRPNLKAREHVTAVDRIRWWFIRNRVRSGLAAAAAAVVVLAIWMGAPLPPVEESAEAYLTNHASMSWRDPFADKAALGLTATMPVEVSWEESK